jgi:hypothetical protein
MSDYKVIRIPNCLNEYGCLPYMEGLAPVNIIEQDGIYLEPEVFMKHYGSMTGQIQRDTPFGALIYYFAHDPAGPQQWLDIGAWNGKGTTQCILDGFHDSNTEKHCVSLEAHPLMFPVARENLMTHPAASKLTLLNQVLTFPGAEAYFAKRSTNSNDTHYKLYYETEYNIWKNGKSVVLPYKPDAVILDGGEYSGYIDWLAIPKENLTAIFLDDVACEKNKIVREELLLDSTWCLLQEDLSDRNGWSVFIKQ